MHVATAAARRTVDHCSEGADPRADLAERPAAEKKRKLPATARAAGCAIAERGAGRWPGGQFQPAGADPSAIITVSPRSIRRATADAAGWSLSTFAVRVAAAAWRACESQGRASDGLRSPCQSRRPLRSTPTQGRPSPAKPRRLWKAGRLSNFYCLPPSRRGPALPGRPDGTPSCKCPAQPHPAPPTHFPSGAGHTPLTPSGGRPGVTSWGGGSAGGLGASVSSTLCSAAARKLFSVTAPPTCPERP